MHITPYLTCGVCLLFFIFTGTAARAQNLVPNPGFEYHTQCPGLGDTIEFAYPWHVPQNHPPSTEYFHTCATSPVHSVPGNGSAPYYNYQVPAAGNGYAGFIMHDDAMVNYREYLQAPLNTPLLPGQMYHVSFRVALADYSRYTSKDLGIYFSPGPVPGTISNNAVIGLTPQLTCPVPITDKNNWTTFHFNYQAAGGEQNILIGCFADNMNISLITLPGSNLRPVAFMLLDEVYVEPAPTWITGPAWVCAWQPVTLTAHGNGPFQWATADAPGTLLAASPTLTVSPGQTTTYYAYGATDTGVYTVYTLPAPAPLNLGPDTAYCINQGIDLIATRPGSQYLWQDLSTDSVFYPAQTGTYWVQVSMGGCTVTDTVALTFSTPEAHLPADTVLCQGQTLTLDATWPNAHYLWNNGSTAPARSVSQTGTYSVQVSIGTCTDTDEIQVTVNPYPIPDLGPDRTVCDNALPLLDATRPGASYVWQNGSTMGTCPVTQTGPYWVNVSLGPCTAADSVYITLIPAPQVNLGPDTLPCLGDTLWLHATGGNLTYLWNDASVLPTHTVTQSGTYAVQVTHSNGCTDTDSITVTYINPPHVQFTDSTLCRGDVWLLDIHTPLGSYLWQDKTENPTYYIQHEGVYWASISNPCGSDSDTLEVEYRRCDCALYVPNCFTPDANGSNECFVTLPHPDCLLQEFTLTVYDRWGDILFSSSNPEFCWNGYRNGKAVPPDMYLYLIRYKFDKAPLRELRGHILLLR